MATQRIYAQLASGTLGQFVPGLDSTTAKKAGVLIFSPIASKRCNTQRVGVTNVFTPPVTG